MTTYLQLSIVNNDTAITKHTINNNDDPPVLSSMCGPMSTAVDYTKHGLPPRLAHESLAQYKDRIFKIDTTANNITEDNTIQKAIVFEKAARKSKREIAKAGTKKKGDKKSTSAYRISKQRRASESRTAAQSTSLKDRLAAFQVQSMPSPHQSMMPSTPPITPPPTTYYNAPPTPTTTTIIRGSNSNGSSSEHRGSFSREKNTKSTIESLQQQEEDEKKKKKKNTNIINKSNRTRRASVTKRPSLTRRVSLTKLRRSSINSREDNNNNSTTNNNDNAPLLSHQSSFTRRSFKERLETLPVEPMYGEAHAGESGGIMSPEELEAKKRVDEWFQRKSGKRDAEYKAAAIAMKDELRDAMMSPEELEAKTRVDEWFQRKQGKRDAEYKAAATAMKAEQYNVVPLPSSPPPSSTANDDKAQAMKMKEQQISTLSSYEELKLRLASAKKSDNGRRISGSLEAASAMSVRDRLASLQKSNDKKKNKNKTILYVDGKKEGDDDDMKKTVVEEDTSVTPTAQEKKKGQYSQPHKSSVVSISVQPPAPVPTATVVATNTTPEKKKEQNQILKSSQERTSVAKNAAQKTLQRRASNSMDAASAVSLKERMAAYQKKGVEEESANTVNTSTVGTSSSIATTESKKSSEVQEATDKVGSQQEQAKQDEQSKEADATVPPTKKKKKKKKMSFSSFFRKKPKEAADIVVVAKTDKVDESANTTETTKPVPAIDEEKVLATNVLVATAANGTKSIPSPLEEDPPLQKLDSSKIATAANMQRLPRKLEKYTHILFTGRFTLFNREDVEQTLMRANKVVSKFPKSSEDRLLLVTGRGNLNDNKKYMKTMKRMKEEEKMTKIMTEDMFHKLWNESSLVGGSESSTNSNNNNNVLVLTKDEILTLRSMLKSKLDISSYEIDPDESERQDEDADGLLDYVFEMLNEGKTVGYVMEEVSLMEMDVCMEKAAENFGKVLTKFLKQKKEEQEQRKAATAEDTTPSKTKKMFSCISRFYCGSKKK